MRELSVAWSDLNGLKRAKMTGLLKVRGYKEPFWVCDAWDELMDAMDDGKPFVGHRVEGMEPAAVILNPAHVASIEQHEKD